MELCETYDWTNQHMHSNAGSKDSILAWHYAVTAALVQGPVMYTENLAEAEIKAQY